MENKPLSSPSLLQTTAALFGEGEKIPSENPCGEARGGGGGGWGGVGGRRRVVSSRTWARQAPRAAEKGKVEDLWEQPHLLPHPSFRGSWAREEQGDPYVRWR